MKLSENDITITRLEFEPGDEAWELYERVGEIGQNATVAIVGGALEFRE